MKVTRLLHSQKPRHFHLPLIVSVRCSVPSLDSQSEYMTRMHRILAHIDEHLWTTRSCDLGWSRTLFPISLPSSLLRMDGRNPWRLLASSAGERDKIFCALGAQQRSACGRWSQSLAAARYWSTS